MRNFNSKKIVFDTNILFDLCDSGRPDHNEAVILTSLCNGGGWMGLVSPMSLKDVYYVMRKSLPETRARKFIAYLMDLFVILPCSFEEAGMAIISDEPDFEDGLIRASAELNDASFIITRDKKAFKTCVIRALTASEFLEVFDR